MPKDNEVDEKVIQRYAPNIVCDGSIDMEPSEFGTWISLSDHAATVAELRAEVVKERERAEKFMWQVRDTCARAEAAERRVGELELALRNLRDAFVFRQAIVASADTIEKIDFADSKAWKACDEAKAALTGSDPT